MDDSSGMKLATLEETAAALRAGKPAIFPTDTVYGVGVAVRYLPDPEILYKLKGRERNKPIAWLVASVADLDEYGADVPAYARAFARRWWPGALTLIVRASDRVPAAYRSAEGTIGLRMPDDGEVLALVKQVGCPLSTTSANPSHAPAPYRAQELDAAFAQAVGTVMLDSGAERLGVASTVIDCTDARPRIVREGAVTQADVDCAFAEDAAAAPDPDAIAVDELTFPSHDGKTVVSACVWHPAQDAALAQGDAAAAPKAIVQIVHGMAEYIGRYDDLARYLANRGFVVCGEDMIGHGKSAASPSDLGCLPVEGGADALVEDMHALRTAVAARYPATTPYIMYGHSMGSFIVRAYLAAHGEGLAAAVLSGTGNPPAATSALGNFLARTIAKRKGADYRSSFIDGMGAGAYGKQIEGARTPFDWLSCDAAVVDRYIADPWCGFMFSVGGYATLTELTGRVVKPACAARVPKNLPVLFVAGALDPVGSCGRDVHEAAELFRRAGVAHVDEKIYPNMRHEIHNEIGRAQVYGFLASWMETNV